MEGRSRKRDEVYVSPKPLSLQLSGSSRIINCTLSTPPARLPPIVFPVWCAISPAWARLSSQRHATAIAAACDGRCSGMRWLSRCAGTFCPPFSPFHLIVPHATPIPRVGSGAGLCLRVQKYAANLFQATEKWYLSHRKTHGTHVPHHKDEDLQGIDI